MIPPPDQERLMTGPSAPGTTLPAAGRTEELSPAQERGLMVDAYSHVQDLGSDLDRDQGTAELGRLEALLAQRAREISRLRGELGMLTVLLRDRLSHGDAVSATIPGAERELEALRVARDAAVARAIEAEAVRAEANFRVDELLGHLRLGPGGAGAPASVPEPVPSVPLDDRRLDIDYARLSGTARGLAAALAEAEDARDIAQARLLLTEQDLSDALARGRSFERSAAEGRDQLELALLMARSQDTTAEPATLRAQEDSALRGELNGLRARVDEGESAFAALADRLKAAQAAADAVVPARAIQPDEFASSSQIADLEQAIAREIENKSRLTAELAGARAQAMILGEELAREQRDARLRVDEQSSALRELRQTLTSLSAALPRTATGAVSTHPQGQSSGGLGIATEPGLPAYLDGLEEQIELRDGRIALLTKHLERERARTAAVARRLVELGRAAEPAPVSAIAELTALFDGESS